LADQKADDPEGESCRCSRAGVLGTLLHGGFSGPLEGCFIFCLVSGLTLFAIHNVLLSRSHPTPKEAMLTLSRDEILATTLPSETVDVPEWGGKVILRGLTALERDDYEQAMVETAPDGSVRAKRKLHNVRASLVVRCVVDEAGERVFTDADDELLGAKDAAVINQLWDVCRRLCGMSTADEEKLAQGFETAQGDTDDSD
jgi:hypothetical protein